MRRLLWTPSVLIAPVLIALVVTAALTLSACGPSVDLVTALRVEGMSSGWADGGRADGLNKLVPTVSFTLTNTSDHTLNLLQVNAVFRRAGEDAEWGARFVAAAGSKGLAPGQTTKVLVLASERGYTGADPHQDMLRNTEFVDTDVDVFAK